MTLICNRPDAMLAETAANELEVVCALQRDLRALGFLRQGTDGAHSAVEHATALDFRDRVMRRNSR